MNTIKMLTGRIEQRLQETKQPCKNYATEEAAEKATAAIAKEVAEHHHVDRADYLVFYIQSCIS